MTLLLDFIAEQPSQSPHALHMYTLIDKEAERIGKKLWERTVEFAGIDGGVDYQARADDARSRNLHWLAGVNQELADALGRDMRLAAVPALRAWAAQPDGVGGTWVNWYEKHLLAYLEHMKQTELVAAE